MVFLTSDQMQAARLSYDGKLYWLVESKKKLHWYKHRVWTPV